MSQDWRRKLLRKLKRWAEDRFPVLFPVRVYMRRRDQMVTDDGGMLGYFTMDDDCERGCIGVVDTLNHGEMIDTFCEEWAHARCAHLLDTEDNDEDTDHHQTFWAEYGRIVKASRGMEW
jgi:hypothetical protein